MPAQPPLGRDVAVPDCLDGGTPAATVQRCGALPIGGRKAVWKQWPQDGLRMLEVIDAARRSAASGQTVELP